MVENDMGRYCLVDMETCLYLCDVHLTWKWSFFAVLLEHWNSTHFQDSLITGQTLNSESIFFSCSCSNLDISRTFEKKMFSCAFLFPVKHKFAVGHDSVVISHITHVYHVFVLWMRWMWLWLELNQMNFKQLRNVSCRTYEVGFCQLSAWTTFPTSLVPGTDNWSHLFPIRRHIKIAYTHTVHSGWLPCILPVLLFLLLSVPSYGFLIGKLHSLLFTSNVTPAC